MFIADVVVVLFTPTAVLLAGTEARGPRMPRDPPAIIFGLVTGLEPALELLSIHIRYLWEKVSG